MYKTIEDSQPFTSVLRDGCVLYRNGSFFLSFLGNVMCYATNKQWHRFELLNWCCIEYTQVNFIHVIIIIIIVIIVIMIVIIINTTIIIIIIIMIIIVIIIRQLWAFLSKQYVCLIWVAVTEFISDLASVLSFSLFALPKVALVD